MTEIAAAGVLTVIAEISIALAGFAGIVVAVRERGIERWSETELIRLRWMLIVACLTLFLSLAPFLPLYLGYSIETTWQVSNVFLFFGLFGIVVVGWLITGKSRSRLSSGWFATYMAGSAISATAVLVNGIGVLDIDPTGIYLVGLVWLLFISTTVFVRLILTARDMESK